MSLPNPPEVNSPMGAYLRKLVYELRSYLLQPGPGYNISRSSSGTSLVIPRAGASLKNLHPFKLYQFPKGLRVHANADDWQRFMVRSGNFYDQVVNGTDKFEYPARSTDDEVYTTNLVPPEDDSQWAANWWEVVVPADAGDYYFWISLVAAPSGTPEVLFGDSVANAIYLEDGTAAAGDEVWADFPFPDPYHFPIGRLTWLEGPARWEIHQYLRDHINGRDPCRIGTFGFVGLDSGSVAQLPMRFAGIYGASFEYFIGDVVLQDSGDFRSQYILCPPFGSATTREDGAISGVSPATNNPDPWLMLSKSPLPAQGVYATGAYDGTKDYLRRA